MAVVELSCRHSPATSVIGLSLLRWRLLLSTSTVPACILPVPLLVACILRACAVILLVACGMVAAGGTAKSALPLPAGGDGDAVLPAPDNGLTMAVELSHQSSPATTTIGLSLLNRRLPLSTSAVPSLPRPRLLRAWSNNGGQIIAPALPRDVHNRVIPPPPAPPLVNIRGHVLAAPLLIMCMGQQQWSNYYAASPPRCPRLGLPSSAGATSFGRPWSHPCHAPARHMCPPCMCAPRGPLLPLPPGRLRGGSGVCHNGILMGGRYHGMPQTRRQGTRRCQGAALLVPCIHDISLAGGKERPWLVGRVSGGLRVAETHDHND
jgi:hypothetical protein